MNWISISIALINGIIIGIDVSYIFKITKIKSAKEIAVELFQENEYQRKESIDSVVNNIKSIF